MHGEEDLRYIAGAFRYVFKNFIFLFPFALIPSYFFATALDIGNLEAIVNKITSADASFSFPNIFNAFSLVNGMRWAFALVSFVCIVLFMPLLLAFIEKHMRIGSRSFKGLIRRINYNFLSTLIFLIIAFAVYEIWALIASGLVYTAVLLFGGIARLIAVAVLAAGMVLLLAYIFSLIWLWLPCLQITGYSFGDALAFSSQIAGGKRRAIWLSLLIPYAVGAALAMVVVWVCAAYEITIPVFVFIEIIYIFLFLYLNAHMYVVYFDAAGEEREDLKKHY